jgi:hypothetical protein
MKPLLYTGLGFVGFVCWIAVMSGRADDRRAQQMQRLMQVPPGGYPAKWVDQLTLPERLKATEEAMTQQRRELEEYIEIKEHGASGRPQ